MTTTMRERMGAVRPMRVVNELERLWQRRHRPVNRRLTGGYSGEVLRLVDSAIDYLVPKCTNATRMLKEQLTAEGISVWLSAGCLEEFASIASVAAARKRQADEPYTSCLRREIVACAEFIREWTSSDRTFDQTQGLELVAIARKYALPRPWRLFEAVACVRAQTVAVLNPARGALKGF